MFLEGMKQTPGERKLRTKCTQPRNSIFITEKKKNNMVKQVNNTEGYIMKILSIPQPLSPRVPVKAVAYLLKIFHLI